MAIQYIIKICEEFDSAATTALSSSPGIPRSIHAPQLNALFLALVEGIDELHPSMFPPDQRFDFVTLRQLLKWEVPPRDIGKLVRITDPVADQVRKMMGILKTYGSEGSSLNTRNFSGIVDQDLRKIIARDYHELRVKLFPSGAWKSTVVLAGSILEAILFDVLSDSGTIASANASLKAPCNNPDPKKRKASLPTERWTLQDLIVVAEDIHKLPTGHAKSIDQVLRDYRNFVHPKKEIRAQHECTESQAYLAIGSLGVILDHLRL